MKKKINPDLKYLWEKAKKKRNVNSTSTPELVTLESQAPILRDSPSVRMQSEPDIAVTEAVASNELEAAGAASTEREVAGAESIEPISLPPFSEIDESDDESSDEATYDLDYLCHDPGKRFPIKCYNVNDRNSVIRGYIALGPCQPREHDFPLTEILGKPRRFVATWFDDYKWLEYSMEVDAVFCFVCYLFKHKTNCSGGDAFVSCGFRNWHIMADLGGDYFAILADESSDVYQKEQLALCLRYVDRKGRVVERFLGVVHVENTTALTLKSAIVTMLMSHGLSLSIVRGQGYDGASNMKGHINGLKKIIMDDSPSAYYVHCFAHQLQLTLMAVARENPDCIWFFDQLRYLLTVIGKSCKKIQMFREAQAQQVIKALDLGEIETGKGQNQEMGLSRPGDTRWGSHYKIVMHVISMYSSIRQVLITVGNDHSQKDECTQAQTMLKPFESYEFVFMAHLMFHIFGYTNDLNHAMQKRDQDIVNAIELIELTKFQLQTMREDQGWKDFLDDVNSFCAKHGLKVADMDGFYKPVGRDKRFFIKLKNRHRFHVDMFLSVIDMQLQELNDRFDEVNTELLISMAAFNPIDSFAAYDKDRLVKLAGFYPKDFSSTEINHLPLQLDQFINDMRLDERFREVHNISQLSIKLIETKKHLRHDVVYKLLKLVLILPVATASVERVFSSMNYVKNKLRNRMGDQYLNDCLVTFIERDFFHEVKDGEIIKRFQTMKRKVELYFT